MSNRPAPPPEVDPLTPRQEQVLEMISRGRSNPEIADALGVSIDGAKWHVREILSKLGVESREEAAAYWRSRRRPAVRLRRLFAPLALGKLGLGVAGGAVAVVAIGVAGALLLSSDDDAPAGAAVQSTPTPLPYALGVTDWVNYGSLGHAVTSAEVIVVGRVTGVISTGGRIGERAVWTDLSVEVTEYVKGSGQPSLTLRYPGDLIHTRGTLEFSAPPFNQDLLLFLYPAGGGANTWSPVIPFSVMFMEAGDVSYPWRIDDDSERARRVPYFAGMTFDEAVERVRQVVREAAGLPGNPQCVRDGFPLVEWVEPPVSLGHALTRSNIVVVGEVVALTLPEAVISTGVVTGTADIPEGIAPGITFTLFEVDVRRYLEGSGPGRITVALLGDLVDTAGACEIPRPPFHKPLLLFLANGAGIQSPGADTWLPGPWGIVLDHDGTASFAWRNDDDSRTPRPVPFFAGMSFGQAVEAVFRAVNQ